MGSSLLLWLSGAVELLLPHECLVCTRPLRGVSLCFRCTPALPRSSSELTGRCQRCFGAHITQSTEESCSTCLLYPPLFDRARYLWEYSSLARDFIRAMKYRPSLVLARMGGEMVGSMLAELFPDSSWDMIVPIPPSASNFRRRLFHPCSEMARRVAQHRKLLPVTEALRRVSNRAPQASLSHSARLRGIRSLFTVPQSAPVAGARILLVEDVITTGATTAAAALALRKAGASSIDVVALARTHVWSRFRRAVFEGVQ